VVSFGGFRLHLGTRILERDGAPVALQPKAVDLLCALAKGNGAVLTKEELLHEVWPGAFVEEGNLAKLVFLLRRELGDGPAGKPWIETLPKRGYRLALPRGPSAGDVEPRVARGIAVLPFDDLSVERDQGPFCEGLAEEILNSLMRVAGLRVVSRGSAWALRGRPAEEIGTRLGVDAVVEGAVRKARERLRVTARLVSTADGAQLWSANFDRPVDDVFAVQEEIAAAIAATLGAPGEGRAGPAPAARRPWVPTRDLEAWELYLRGRYLWHRRPGAVVFEALGAFEEAVRRDPHFALAWAGIADVYGTLGSWESGVLPHGAAQSRAREAAARALALDPHLAEAHTALAYAALHHDWDFAVAERTFRHALELNPQYAAAHHWLAHDLMAAGRSEEAAAESRLALACDPLSLLLHVHVSWHHHMARQPEQVIEQSLRVLGMDDRFHWGHYFLGWGHEAQGDTAAAVAAHRRAVELSGEEPVMLAGLGRALAMDGETRKARAALRELAKRGGDDRLFAYETALIHLGLGERDLAFADLEVARMTRSGWLAYLGVDPRLDPLRDDPRFEALRRAAAHP